MPKITFNMDSTSLGHSGCPKAFVQTTVGDIQKPELGAYTSRQMSVNLVYGIAVHAFLETMYKTNGHFPIARKKAQELFTGIPFQEDRKKRWMNDWTHVLVTCNQVWTEYCEPQMREFELLQIQQKAPDGSDNIVTGPAVEVNFKFKYYEDDYIIVYLCGTIDRLGTIKNGVHCIRDWKTTGAWDTIDYFTQYELSRQLRFYKLACRLMSKLMPDSAIGKLGGHESLGVAIDGIFLTSNANETKVISSEVFRVKDKDVDEFERTLQNFITGLSVCVKDNFFPKTGILNGTCEKKYSKSEQVFSKCAFWNCCKSPDDIAQLLLERDFGRKLWEPLSFNK